MARGGKRPGAGRPQGSRNIGTKQRIAIADRAASEGITPLEVMLNTMRAHYDAQKFDEASAVARDAAPYVHARLSSIDMSLEADLKQRVISEREMSPGDWEAKYGQHLEPKPNGHANGSGSGGNGAAH